MTVVEAAARAAQLSADRVPFVYATVVRAVSPTSARAGDTAVIHSDGRVEGFVGGMCAESSVRLYSLQALANGQPLLLRILPTELPEPTSGEVVGADGSVTVGNPCLSGGAIEVFLEPRQPAPRMLVVGDTPIARALAELGRPLGYLVEAVSEAVAPPSASDAALVVASHGRDEVPALEAALAAGVPYVGLVASRRRGAEVLAALSVTDEQRALVHTPAGLWIGAQTAAEVALSILAEMVSLRRSVDAQLPGSASANAIADAGSPAPTAIDPICGMTVAAVPSSLSLPGVDGETVYFCGAGCRSAFAGRG